MRMIWCANVRMDAYVSATGNERRHAYVHHRVPMNTCERMGDGPQGLREVRGHTLTHARPSVGATVASGCSRESVRVRTLRAERRAIEHACSHGSTRTGVPGRGSVSTRGRKRRCVRERELHANACIWAIMDEDKR
eukprot:6189875-Pleurochrysis_carterae.AAC.3